MTPKPKVLWLQGITCNGNSHSFMNASDLNRLLEDFDFVHHPVFPTPFSIESVALKRVDADILVIEGALREKGFMRAGVEVYEIARHYAKRANRIICVGNCASFGGIFKESDPGKITGALFEGERKRGLLEEFAHKTINLPGCPVHPQWLSYTLRMIKNHRNIRLDNLFRPVELYGYTVHEGCLRNEYFEWKVDADSYGHKEGCLFYKQGCQGPFTHGSCNRILWNEVSSKTRAGMPCIGCTEPDFPSGRLFETKTLMSIPARLPLGVPKRAYLTLVGVAKAFSIPRLEKRKFDED